jgi:DNA-binding CsgD family transcriptional regulator
VSGPLIVVEAPGAVAALRAEVERAGCRVVEAVWVGAADPSGPVAPGPRPRDGAAGSNGPPVVRLGEVSDGASAAHAVLAALAGDGVLVVATAGREVVDRLCDDLRRLGPVRHVVAGTDPPAVLTDDQRALLRLLLAGDTLGTAAARLHLSRRTADRRIADIRRHYGVTSTAGALAAARDRADL